MSLSLSNLCLNPMGSYVDHTHPGDYGLPGLGNTDDVNAPPTTPIDLGTNFLSRFIDCGEHHCCAVSTENTMKCWG